MSSDEKTTKQRRRRRPAGCEHQSDRRTVEFVIRQITEAQDQLADLINDLRGFEHYSEIEDLGWCLMLMQRLKRKYRKFLEDGVWPDSS